MKIIGTLMLVLSSMITVKLITIIVNEIIIEINSKLISHSSKIKVIGDNKITEIGKIIRFKDRTTRKLETKTHVLN